MGRRNHSSRDNVATQEWRLEDIEVGRECRISLNCALNVEHPTPNFQLRRDENEFRLKRRVVSFDVGRSTFNLLIKRATRACRAKLSRRAVSRGKNRTWVIDVHLRKRANRVRQGGPYGLLNATCNKGNCNGLVKNSVRLVALAGQPRSGSPGELCGSPSS